MRALDAISQKKTPTPKHQTDKQKPQTKQNQIKKTQKNGHL